MNIYFHYVIYYLIPVAFIIISWKLWYDKGYLNSFWTGWNKQKLEKEYKKLKIKLYKTIAIFVIVLLITLSIWGFVATEIIDHQLKRERIGGSVFSPVFRDPVTHQIGPSYELDPILEEMEDNPGIWIPEELQGKVDFEDLTSIPGRLTVYRLRQELFGPRIIITYTYISPLPITRAYGFQFEIPEEDGEEVVFYVAREENYLFPMDPGAVSEIADF